MEETRSGAEDCRVDREGPSFLADDDSNDCRISAKAGARQSQCDGISNYIHSLDSPLGVATLVEECHDLGVTRRTARSVKWCSFKRK